jgi:hypothetical protein
MPADYAICCPYSYLVIPSDGARHVPSANGLLMQMCVQQQEPLSQPRSQGHNSAVPDECCGEACWVKQLTFSCFLRSERSCGKISSYRNLYCFANTSFWKALPPTVGSKRGSLPALKRQHDTGQSATGVGDAIGLGEAKWLYPACRHLCAISPLPHNRVCWLMQGRLLAVPACSAPPLRWLCCCTEHWHLSSLLLWPGTTS